MRTGRPVKMVMEYREEFFAGAPRQRDHEVKTGVKRDGTIVAHEMEAYLDAGAYGGFRPGAVVGGDRSCAAVVIAPSTHVFQLRASTRIIYRRPDARAGEPQGFFAAESHMDCVARKVGMDPCGISHEEFNGGR